MNVVSENREPAARRARTLGGMKDDDTRYEAVSSRDARFDGEFFFAVRTTGIYCRPSCPAVTPKRRNVAFFPTAAAAQGHGFRACRRCRPDAVPGSAAWDVRADVVGRAMRMIGDGVVDREGVPGLAGRLGYSTRQVQRQLTAELGAGPVALARAQRAHTARLLLQTTGLPVTEIAFAAGFASVRQFNETIRAVYARTPTALRAEAGSGAGACTALAAGVPLRLAHRGPYAAGEVFDLLAAEAVPRVEEVVGAPGARTYRRTLRLPYGTGVVSVDERSAGRWLDARIHLTELRDLTTAVHRLRRLFDLDADPYAVAERLGAAPGLAAEVAARPGVRSPGTADPEEFALRTVLGAVESARVVERYGTPGHGLRHPDPRLSGTRRPDRPPRRGTAGPRPRRRSRTPRSRRRPRRGRARPARRHRCDRRVRRPHPDAGPRRPGRPPPGCRDTEDWRPWRSYAARYLATAPVS